MDTQHSSRPPLWPAEHGEGRCLGLIAAWIEAWVTTCQAYWRAAATYEELYRLSDSALEYRGYRRARLAARDVTGFDVTHHADC